MISDLNVRMWPYRMSHGTSILKIKETYIHLNAAYNTKNSTKRQ